MKQLLPICIALCCAMGSALSQTNTFLKIFSWKNEGAVIEYPYTISKMIKTNDNGYVFAGKYAVDLYNTHSLIFKVDKNGDSLWLKTYSITGNSAIHNIIELPTGDFLLAGSTNPGARSFVMKINATGDSIDARTFKINTSSEAIAVRQNSSGGYLVAGKTFTTTATTQNDIYTLQLDSNLDSLTYFSFGGAKTDIPTALKPAQNDEYIICGYSNSGNWSQADYSSVLFRINSAGDTVWLKHHIPGRAMNLNVNADGTYMVVGYYGNNANPGTKTDVMITKFGAAGDTLWTKNIGAGNNVDDKAEDVIETSDGNFMVSAHTYRPNQNNVNTEDVYLIKITPDGNVLWEKTYDLGQLNPSGEVTDYTVSIFEISGGFVIAGMTGKLPFLMVVDFDGNIDLSSSSENNVIKKPALLRIYPNPFSEQTTLKVEPYRKGHTITLYNILGETVRHISVMGQQTIIKREGLQSGIYFYEIRDDSQRLATGKLIIH